MSEVNESGNSAIGMETESLPEEPVTEAPSADSVNSFFDDIDSF